MENPVTTIAVIASIVGLFGFTLKLVLPRILDKLDQKDHEIRDLTAKFTETQNHKTTEMTGALKSLVVSNEKYATAVEAQTEVFKVLLKR